MNRETTIDRDKTILNTEFYIYLMKQENTLSKFEKWLKNETFNKEIMHYQYGSALRKCYDKLLELKGVVRR